MNVKKAKNGTDPFLNGHKAGELGQDGELFAQLDDEGLQLRFLPLGKQEKNPHQQVELRPDV